MTTSQRWKNQGPGPIAVYLVVFGDVNIEVYESTETVYDLTGLRFDASTYVGVWDGLLQVTSTPIPGAAWVTSVPGLIIQDGILYYDGGLFQPLFQWTKHSTGWWAPLRASTGRWRSVRSWGSWQAQRQSIAYFPAR